MGITRGYPSTHGHSHVPSPNISYAVIRLINGGNIAPFFRGRSSTARRVMQIFLLFACYADPTLVRGFGFRPSLCSLAPQALEVEGNHCTLSDATPYPCCELSTAMWCSIFQHYWRYSRALKRAQTNHIRMYSAWSRLFVVPILLFIILYYSFNIQGSSLSELTEGFTMIIPLGLLILSRVLQIVITEQYIALVDRIRLTRLTAHDGHIYDQGQQERCAGRAKYIRRFLVSERFGNLIYGIVRRVHL